MARGAASSRTKPLSSIAAAANAPVYVFVDQYVGLGAVGGNVYSLETHGAHVAALGLQILRGASPASLPIRELGAQVDLFDARQLRRWNLDEARLPPGSVVRYQDPSVWALYRWYIIAAIAVLVTQGALIGGLLLARARQRRAEAEARRQRDDLAHVLRVTTLGELTTSLAHEISQPLTAILLNAQAARRFLESGRPADAKDVRRGADRYHGECRPRLSRHRTAARAVSQAARGAGCGGRESADRGCGAPAPCRHARSSASTSDWCSGKQCLPSPATPCSSSRCC